MPTSPIATAADYADAMMAGRRAKNWLFLLLLFSLIAQVTVFFVLRHYPTLGANSVAEVVTATTEPVAAKSVPKAINVPKLLQGVVAASTFMGLTLAIVLAVVQLLLVTIMLVGRLIGVSKVTGAFIWSVVLIVLLFPWQSILMSPVSSEAGVAPTAFEVPGVLYTWSEVIHPTLGAGFNINTPLSSTLAYLRWARFVIWPAIAILLLMIIQSKSSRGLRMALGEVEFDIAESSRMS